jgi:hypothetical protein
MPAPQQCCPQCTKATGCYVICTEIEVNEAPFRWTSARNIKSWIVQRTRKRSSFCRVVLGAESVSNAPNGGNVVPNILRSMLESQE